MGLWLHVLQLHKTGCFGGLAVSNVTFNTINNSTGSCNSPAYNNFSCSQTTILDASTAYNLSVTLVGGGSGYSEWLEVWIDWDNSGTFQTSNSFGANERVLIGNTSSTQVFSTSITPPAGAVKDRILRMRVMGEASNSGDPFTNNKRTCSSSFFVGDIEDYGVLVQSVSACTDPTITNFTASTNPICNGNSTTLTVTGSLNDATAWHLYSGSCGGTLVASNSTGTFNVSPTTTTTYFVRGEGGCVTPGTCQQITITVNNVPAQPSTISGNTTVCQGSSQVYSVTNVAGVTYNWSFPAGWTQTAGGTTNSITVTVGASSGNVTVTPSNACGNGTARNLAVTVNTVPNQPSTISGSTTPCQGSSQVYSVTNVAGVTYNWSFPAGWTQTAGGTTNSITVTVGASSGNVTVTPSNACGNGTARNLAVTVNTVPNQPSAISGSTTPCQGSSQVYSVTNVAGVTYNWSFPAGWTQTGGGTSNSITVTVGANSGNVTVTPSNACGNGTARNLAVTVNTVPAQPSTISGNTTVCEGSSQVYSVTNVAGITYNWNFPAGWTQTGGGTSNSVTVTVGANSGNVTVTPSNACGNGTARSLAVTVNTVPNQPSIISGTTTPCQGSSQVYSVTNVAGVTYNWSFPAGWTQTAGGTTNSITVTVGASSGNVTVTPSNACGNGTARSLGVTVNLLSGNAGAISGSATVCANATGVTYSIAAVANATNYAWTVPAGATITAGQGTTSITVNFGATGGSITVTPSNSCGNGLSSNLNISVSSEVTPSLSIGSSATEICSGTNVTFTATPTNQGSSPTYQWFLNGNPVGTNSTTYNNNTLNNGDQVRCELTNSDACANPNTVSSNTITITVNTVPAQPSAIAGNNSVCEGTTQTYSVTNVAGVSYAWSVPAGWSIDAGQGSNSINVMVGAGSGTVSVTPSNSCGNGTARNLSVTVSSVPSQPSVVTGNMEVCEGSSQTYSVTNVSGLTYTWSLPAGWSINSGQGTNTITVTTGANSGNVTVIPSNTCGEGTGSNLAVTISGTVTPSISIAANTTAICVGENVSFTATPTNGGSSPTYQWFLNGNPVGGNSSTYSNNTLANGDQVSVTLTSSDACADPTTANSNVVTMTVNSAPVQPSTISGFTAVCSGEEGVVYSIDPVANADTYTWTVPGGSTIASGQGTTSIIVNFSSSSGNVSVVASNGCGNSTARTLSVNVTDCATGPTHLRDKHCGATITLSYEVSAVPVQDATQYQWELTSQTDGAVLTIAKTGNKLRLREVNGIKYNTTYNVQVRAYVNSAWTNWGKSCELSSEGGDDGYPETRIKDGYCGNTYSLSHQAACYAIILATDYWWEFTAMSDGSVINFVRGSDATTMRFFQAGLAEGETYSVRVRPFVDGGWRSYGTNCLITISGSSARPTMSGDGILDFQIGEEQLMNENSSIKSFENDVNRQTITVFPNPANKLMPVAFAVTELTSSEKTVTIEVIDMFGKKVLVKEVNNNNGYVRDYLHFENTIASGTYFILIKTSEEVITKRFIIE
jgi:hypothetical protein